MAVFFNELAVEGFFRVVKRSLPVFLPVLAPRCVPGGECFHFPPDASQGGKGRYCQINGQQGPEPHAAVPEGMQEEEGQERVKDGRRLEEEFIVHDARPEEEAAGQHAQRDVVEGHPFAGGKKQYSRQQDAQKEGEQETGVFDGVRIKLHLLLRVVECRGILACKQAGELTSAVKIRVKDAHDSDEQGRGPKDRMAEKMPQIAGEVLFRRPATEEGFIQNVREERHRCERRPRQQHGPHEIAAGSRQGAGEDQNGAHQGRNGVVECVE